MAWHKHVTLILVLLWVNLAQANPFEDARITKIGGDFAHPWGITLIDDETALVTERNGRLTRLDLSSGARQAITGVPMVYAKRQGGLFDVLAHDNIIYFCFSRAVDGGAATALARAKLVGNKLDEVELMFTSNLVSKSGVHFGCRLVFADDAIYLSHGDRGSRDVAQDMASHGGAVIKIEIATGKISIFSKGHRNPQGMAVNPKSGAIWVNEHGPRGGDEINVLKNGANFGWPIVSHGREYSGRKVGDGLISKAGFVDPIWVWVPSIAPSGMAFYNGAMFPAFKGGLLVTSLKFRSLYHVSLEDGRPSAEVPYLKNLVGRLRDVEVMADGAVLLLSDEAQGGVYKIWR